jgi:hypothetical protein
MWGLAKDNLPMSRAIECLGLALMLSAMVHCGGVSDPHQLHSKRLSELQESDIRGICAYNLKTYRNRIERKDWDTHHCATTNLVINKVKSGTPEQCAASLNECGFPPSYEIWTPEKDCERVELDNVQACTATVEELQACIEERLEATKRAIPIIRDKQVCKKDEPLRSIDILNGKHCSHLKTTCPGFRLALPGFVRAIN